METSTVRQRIISLLAEKPMSARDLSAELRISMKDVPGHIAHVARSVRPERRLAVVPAKCLACGFVFADRSRYTIPSRCPKCRHEGTSEPIFSVVETR